MTTIFKVKTDAFEGPLDVLLDLIEKRKFFISDISLAEVADDYLAYINNLENFPTGDAASFLFVASTLVLIKSKSLLPSLELTEDEQGDIEDLERRLRLYKIFRDVVPHIQERFGENIMFPRERQSIKKNIFAPHKSITLEASLRSILNVISQLPKKEPTPEATVKKVMNIEEMIDTLIGRVQKNMNISFAEFSKKGKAASREGKLNVIIGFLAMLELVKQGVIATKQDELFSDIEMQSRSE